MNVISRPAIDEAVRRHRDAEKWLNAWWKIANRERWSTLEEVRSVYPQTDQVGSCLVFDVLGNKYRLIAGVRYATPSRGGTLFVKQFLTHAEYSKNDWRRECCYDDQAA
jgi:mRNA interferase HigB